MEGASFHRLAERELNAAAAHYEIQRPGLGASFLKEIDRCIDLIVQQPRAGQIVLGDVRRRLVRRFPYAILYTLRPDQVRVLAVMNLRRKPFYWVGRS